MSKVRNIIKLYAQGVSKLSIGERTHRIRTFLTDSLISIVFAVITLVMYTIIMATYHLGLLGIFLP